MRSQAASTFVPALPDITVDRSLAFEQPANRAAFEYWNGLRGARAMPARAELKPIAMRRFLQFVNLVDIDPRDGRYTVGLQSQHAREVFGDLARRKFAELFPPDVAERWRWCFNLARDTAGPVRLATPVGTHGQLWLQCEVLIAPLSGGEDGKLASLFWVFVSWNRDSFAEARA